MTKLILIVLIVVIVSGLIISVVLLSKNSSRISENKTTNISILKYSTIVEATYKAKNTQDKINISFNITNKNKSNDTNLELIQYKSSEIKFYSLSGTTSKKKMSTNNYLCITPISISEIYSVDLEEKFKDFNYAYYVVDKNKKEYFVVTTKELPSHVEMICGRVDYFDNTTVILGELFV